MNKSFGVHVHAFLLVVELGGELLGYKGKHMCNFSRYWLTVFQCDYASFPPSPPVHQQGVSVLAPHSGGLGVGHNVVSVLNFNTPLDV